MVRHECSERNKRTLKQGCLDRGHPRAIGATEHKNRSSVAESVCRHFGFLDARQRTQTGGCVKALRELERAGHFVLPAVTRKVRAASTPRRLGQPVALAIDVPAQAGEVRGLTLIIVDNVDLMRVWNELMLCEHPQAPDPWWARSMRYLIGSEHGWLGGLGFGASALQLADRDQWIGWAVQNASPAFEWHRRHESVSHPQLGELPEPGSHVLG